MISSIMSHANLLPDKQRGPLFSVGGVSENRHYQVGLALAVAVRGLGHLRRVGERVVFKDLSARINGLTSMVVVP